MGLTVALGGARSGKSAWAVELASSWGSPVTFVATAEARDEEMERRIERHRAARPRGWQTLEAPIDLEACLAEVPESHGIVVDCLSLWVANLMERELTDDAIFARSRSAAEIAASRMAVAVSNEVGMGIVPDNALARHYRDVLGGVNRVWAEIAERAVLVVAGRALELTQGSSTPVHGSEV